MLEELRRRKKMKDFYDLDTEKTREEFRKDPDRFKKKTGDNFVDKIDDFASPKQWARQGPERYFEKKKGEIFSTKDFTLIFIASDTVTNVTSLNRVNHRRVLIYIGNGAGLCSFGKGKSSEYEMAFDQAFKKLRQNMVCIPNSLLNTTPTMLRGRHNDFRIKIWSQQVSNFWGNPTIWKLLIHSGFLHCRFACKSRKRDPYSMIYAFFIAITQNTTLEEISRVRGEKMHNVGWVDPTAQKAQYNLGTPGNQ